MPLTQLEPHVPPLQNKPAQQGKLELQFAPLAAQVAHLFVASQVRLSQQSWFEAQPCPTAPQPVAQLPSVQ